MALESPPAAIAPLEVEPVEPLDMPVLELPVEPVAPEDDLPVDELPPVDGVLVLEPAVEPAPVVEPVVPEVCAMARPMARVALRAIRVFFIERYLLLGYEWVAEDTRHSSQRASTRPGCRTTAIDARPCLDGPRPHGKKNHGVRGASTPHVAAAKFASKRKFIALRTARRTLRMGWRTARAPACA